MGTLVRFVVVGSFNTLVGYSIILLALSQGLHDYPANALGYIIGFPVSYLLQRSVTFRDRMRPTVAQALAFGLAMFTAYLVNLLVVFLARSAGYVQNPLVQALAIGTYAIVFFVLSRFFVFNRPKVPSPSKN